MKFRKRPATINAWPVSEVIELLITETPGVPEQIARAYKEGELRLLPNNQIEVTTLEGTHIMALSDYLIEGVEGEFYGCKSGIFHKTYERVEDDE